GARVLAVAAGAGDALQLLGVAGLSDPPRPDAADLIAQIKQLGVRVCMATGDAEETARAIGAQLGLGTRVCHIQPGAALDPAQGNAGPPQVSLPPAGGGLGAAQPWGLTECDLYARVLPEDKHHIVAALQKAGHVTGMTGDGVNDAPALRQAEMGIAVASATDVAKAAAGVVLTDPGLGGVLTVVRAGRQVHRRMLTYTLNKVLRTLEIVIFLTFGLLITGHFIISPLLIVLMLFANDFATMSIATDRVLPAALPQRWQVRKLMGASIVLAALSLLFAWGLYVWAQAQGLSLAQLQTVVFLILVFGNQAGIYLLRSDGPLWQLAPSRWMAAASIGDLLIVCLLAGLGMLMAALPWLVVSVILLATVVFTLLLDTLIKRPLFRRFSIA
ncbi:MAG: HAD-IC family P-type ATPase, partial [Thiomonas sp.]|nr:HAD-IC family P-type ATPase [Thiomonas sp.]